jgi:hypothetical protein
MLRRGRSDVKQALASRHPFVGRDERGEEVGEMPARAASPTRTYEARIEAGSVFPAAADLG